MKVDSDGVEEMSEAERRQAAKQALGVDTDE